MVQRFLDRGGDDVQVAVAEAIHGKVLPLSLQVYGCRVVQKALEVRGWAPPNMPSAGMTAELCKLSRLCC